MPTIQCSICEHEYEPQDMAYCPVYDGPICSLCCSLDAQCHDACKSSATAEAAIIQPQLHNSLALRRLVKYLGLFAIAAGLVAVIFGIVYYQQPASIPFTVLLELYAALLIAIGIVVWWLVLTQESHQLAQNELDKQNLQLQQEINERKQAEATLFEREERFRVAAQSASDLIYEWDIAGNTLNWFGNIDSHLGYEQGNFPRTLEAWEQIIHPDDYDRVVAALDRHLTADEPYREEYRVRRKDGTYIIWIDRGSALRDEAGKPYKWIGVNTDVTDRKQAEAALRQSEELYKQILDAIPDMVLCKEPQLRILYANKAFRQYYGMSVAELRGLIDAPFSPPDYTQQYVLDDAQVFNTGQSLNIAEEPIARYDGQVRLFHTIKTPIFDAAGKVVQLVAVMRDIVESKRAEEALQQKTSELEAIFEAFPDLYFRMSLDGMILDYKADTVSDLYIPPEVFINRRMPELLPPNVGDLFVEAIARLQQTQSLVGIEYELPMPEVSKSYEARLLPLGTNQIITIVRDISDRKQALDAMRQKVQQEQLLNQLANQIRSSLDIDEILETAVGSIRDLLRIDRCMFIRYCADTPAPFWEVVQEASNPVLPRLLGFRAASVDILPLTEKALNKEIKRINDSRTLSDPIIQQFYQSLGYDAELTLPVYTQSGVIGIVCCAHTVARVWQDQEVALLQAVADQLAIALNQADLYKQSRLAAETAQAQAQQLERTLQELRHTQAQLVQTEKMSSLGQRVAGVAHEVNNPVNFIHGNLTHATEYTQDLLRLVALYQQHYPTPCSAIQAEVEAIDLDFLLDDLPKLLTSMKVGTERIRQIVLALRNFSRMDEAEKKTVDIHDGIDSTLMILQNRLKAKAEHVGIEVVKDYGNLPLVECYAGQLNQVFMNILSNAIDALDEYNERTPTAVKQQPSRIAIRTELANNQRVRIWICDNGPGMSEQTRQRLFEPFFTTKPIGKGTGLGLSISYQVVVERHGGELNCVSAPGQGATFLLELPLAQGTREQGKREGALHREPRTG